MSDESWRNFLRGDSIDLARGLIQDNLIYFFKYLEEQKLLSEKPSSSAIYQKAVSSKDLSDINPIWKEKFIFHYKNTPISSTVLELYRIMKTVSVSKNSLNANIKVTLEKYADFFSTAKRINHYRNVEAHQKQKINETGFALGVAADFMSLFEKSLVLIEDQEKLKRIKENLKNLFNELLVKENPNIAIIEEDDENTPSEEDLNERLSKIENGIFSLASGLEVIDDSIELIAKKIKSLEEVSEENKTVINSGTRDDRTYETEINDFPEEIVSAEEDSDNEPFEDPEEIISEALTPQQALNKMWDIQREIANNFQCENWQNLAQGPWRNYVLQERIKTKDEFLEHDLIKERYQEHKEILDKQINSEVGERFFKVIESVIYVEGSRRR
tara:strand:- start:614 stop:1771 length:1158 start_codon:yes stop_codon:yes gene_type:complete